MGTHGPPENKMGIKCSNTAEVYFENTPIPIENVIGKPGEGFKVAMQILNNGRFGMAAALSGTQRFAIKKAVDHAITRHQFGGRIDSYGAIQEKIARMSMTHYATECLAYMVSGLMDKGVMDYQLEAAISKIFASEAAWFVTDEAIQVLGGMGYMRDTGLEKVLREVAKRGKGAIGMSSANMLADSVHPNLVESAALLCNDVAMFGDAVEKLLIKHGKHIINEQFLLNRLAQPAIDIYISSCMMSRCSQSLTENLGSARHEEIMTKVYCSEASNRIALNLGALKSSTQLNNFKLMADISKTVCENEDVLQGNPLGL